MYRSPTLPLCDPITLLGLTALSVEMGTKIRVRYEIATSASRRVPTTLFSTASPGWASIMGTRLKAAASKTTSGRNLAKISCSRWTCLISARTADRRSPG